METTARLRSGAKSGSSMNVGKNERIVSALAGGALALLALRAKGARRSLLGLAGAALVHRGATGHCHLYDALGIDRAREKTRPEAPSDAGFSGTARTAIRRPAHELYDFWRDFTTAPRFRDSITAVEILDASTSR